jgi:hypothetical protein
MHLHKAKNVSLLSGRPNDVYESFEYVVVANWRHLDHLKIISNSRRRTSSLS